MHNWVIFLIGFVGAQIFYVINQTRVKNLYSAWDLLTERDNFENIFFK